MKHPSRYWFPAKLYGWGWGLPNAWQGWVVYACYAVATAALFYFVPPRAYGSLHALLFILLTVVLVIICWLKGEPSRWRWGK